MAIKLTPTRRSQLLEQLLKQNQEQFAQNPQTGLELGLKLLAQGIRQGGINRMQEQEASRESQVGANTANLASMMMGGPSTDFQGRPIQGATEQPNMAQAVGQTLKQDPQNPLAMAALQSQLNKETVKQKVERVPLELTDDIEGVGKKGDTVMGFFRANPVTGDSEYGVGSRAVDPTKVRPTETRTATRDTTPQLTKAQQGKALEDLGKNNQTSYKIKELLSMDPKDFLTVGSKWNIFKGTAKDKLNLPFWQIDPEEQKYLAEAQRFNGMTSQLFQAIRTEVTGAQAAMVELKYLEAAYLSGKMGPTQYKSALMLLDDMNEMAMQIKSDLVSEGYGAIDPRTGKMDTASLQEEFGRRFDQQWDAGKAYDIVEPEEIVNEQPGDDIPAGVDPEDWKYMTEEQKALWR